MATRTRHSRWSIQLGRALGIPIRVHFTLLLLLAWFGWNHAQSGSNPVLAVVAWALVFGCILLHELGHAAMARRLGVHTRDIVLYPIGGVARLENIPDRRAELLIALAGPAVNLVLVFLLLPAMLMLRLSPEILMAEGQLIAPSQLVIWLLVANLILFFFNLIPAFPMDGGRVLRAALASYLPVERATNIATAVGQSISILFGVAAIVLGAPGLILIALFVFIGASQEAFVYRQRTAVRGKTAGDAMITRFEILAPSDSLKQAATHLLETQQQDFPVVDAWGRVAGMLSRARLIDGLAGPGADAAVLEVMERDVPVATLADDLHDVLQRLRMRPQCPVVVFDGERLAGMLTLGKITEFIEVTKRATG